LPTGNFDIPSDYVVSKFYEFGYKVSHNTHNGVYNCCCPICKEGKSWGSKKRCFYIPKDEIIYCHNCGWSSKPYKWIKEVSGLSYKQIMTEIESGNFGIIDVMDMDETPKPPTIIQSLPDDSVNLFDNNQVDYYKSNNVVQKALAYVRQRGLDKAVNRPDAFYLSLKDKVHKNRLVIPFKAEGGKIIYYQTRRILDDDSPSYLSKDGGGRSVFGIERVSSNLNKIFLIEGPLDACFVKNGLGLGGITKGQNLFTQFQQEQIDSLKFFDRIWVLDSQWIDKTAREKTNTLIEMGETVFIWPEYDGKKFKDMNELCNAYEINEYPTDLIVKNSSKGLAAKVKMKMIGDYGKYEK
jgi:hypothetical protein